MLPGKPGQVGRVASRCSRLSTALCPHAGHELNSGSAVRRRGCDQLEPADFGTRSPLQAPLGHFYDCGIGPSSGHVDFSGGKVVRRARAWGARRFLHLREAQTPAYERVRGFRRAAWFTKKREFR